MSELDVTHDPGRRSWVAEANEADSPFPVQNLPYASFRRRGTDESFRVGVAIGDRILDLAAAMSAVTRQEDDMRLPACLAEEDLGAFMALGREQWRQARRQISSWLEQGSSVAPVLSACLVEQAQAEYALPARIPDYTDFYASIDHATNIGKLFRPDSPLMPNYTWLPVAYHGRSSSIIVSGETVRRPHGQLRPTPDAPPFLASSRRLDYELEVGMFLGNGNPRGRPIDIDGAEDHLFGLCLVNDWSARDIQAFEYQPLGPFLGKNFATTVSPWVVTIDALEPFRIAWDRRDEDRQVLGYLDTNNPRANRAVDMELEVLVQSGNMRAANREPVRIGASNFRHAYWTPAQMITHHAVNGCNLRPGDLLASGTMSGPGSDQTGALIEATQGGKNPVSLGDGETRAFLEDGDTVILRARCARDGYRSIGFGECRGTIEPAIDPGS